MGRRPSFRAVLPLLATLVVASCTDSGRTPTGLGAGPALLSLGEAFSGLAVDDAPPIHFVRAWAVSSETGEMLSEVVEEEVDPTASSWTVDLQVEVEGPTDIVVFFELLHEQGGEVLFSGRTEPITVVPGEVTEVAEDQVETVRGPQDNLDVTALEITTAPPVVLETATATLEAAVEGTESATVFWESLDPAIATVARIDDNTAVVTGVETGTVIVVAEAGTATDSVSVRVTAPSFVVPAGPTTFEARGGTPVEGPPGVQVLDDLELPVPGVEVTFQTGDFGGLNGDAAALGDGQDAVTVVTDAEGFASVPGWTLGIRSGTYTLTATVAGTTLEPVVFTATALPTLAGVTDVEASQVHTCALNGAGEAFCWGSNSHGQIGNTAVPVGAAVWAPVPVEGGLLFTEFAKSDFFTTCALDPEGVLYCWGRDVDLSGAIQTTPTADHALSGPLFREFALGFNHSCGITVQGEALCAGTNDDGQLGDPNAGSFTGYHAPVGGIEFVEISPAFLTTCGLASDGTVYCWGTDSFGALGDGEPFGNRVDTPQPVASELNGSFTDFGGGVEYNCATTASGDAHCWGVNSGSQTGVGMDPVQVPTVGTPTPVAGPVSLFDPSLAIENSILIHGCALDAQGEGLVYCWGMNDFGQVGAATTDICEFNGTPFDCAWEPTLVGGGLSAFDVTLGIQHTCAATPSGDVLCWGRNQAGQLGNETTTNSTDPVTVAPVTLDPAGAVVPTQNQALTEPDRAISEGLRRR